MNERRLNLNQFTPAEFAIWLRRAESDFETSHQGNALRRTRERLRELLNDTDGNLSEYLIIGQDLHKIIAAVHPEDVLHFFVHQISKSIDIQEFLLENLIMNFNGRNITLIPLERYEERFDVGDQLKYLLFDLWHREYEGYFDTPEHVIAEIENCCIALVPFLKSQSLTYEEHREVEELFFRIGKIYEKYVQIIMYCLIEVIQHILKIPIDYQLNDRKSKDTQKSLSLADIEKRIHNIHGCLSISDISPAHRKKLKQICEIIEPDESLQSQNEQERPQLRSLRNRNVHGRLSSKDREIFRNLALEFVEKAKAARIVTGYITRVCRSTKGVYISLKVDGSAQFIELFYNEPELIQYTIFKKLAQIQQNIYKERVMVFPVSAAQREFSQPFMVRYGFFDTKNDKNKCRSIICYKTFDIKYSTYTPKVSPPTQEQPVVE
jgi:hypothetical protein